MKHCKLQSQSSDGFGNGNNIRKKQIEKPEHPTFKDSAAFGAPLHETMLIDVQSIYLIVNSNLF